MNKIINEQIGKDCASIVMNYLHSPLPFLEELQCAVAWWNADLFWKHECVRVLHFDPPLYINRCKGANFAVNHVWLRLRSAT